MQMTRHGWVWALVFPAAGLAGGCSLALDWSPDGQGCEQGQCLAGYSCVNSRCVGDHSLSAGEECLTDLQCKDSLCTGPAFEGLACRKACTSFFQKDRDCDADSYCRPAPDPASTTFGMRGSCVKSECAVDADCQVGPKKGSICVLIDSNVGACVLACYPPTGSNGIPYCAGIGNIWQTGGTQYCQPLGKSGSTRLVCVQQSSVTASASCGDKVASPTCDGASGLVCIASGCKSYCDTHTGQPCAGSCAALQTADAMPITFGYCPGT